MTKRQIEFKDVNEIEREVARFKRYLRRQELSDNTIISYCTVLRRYLHTHDHVSKDSAIIFKSELMDTCTPTTVNQRVQGLNKYFNYANLDIRLHSVKVQHKPYLENVISMQDYIYLKRKLKRRDDLTFYFLIWGIACTGARISEILTTKVEHIVDGKMDFYGKGKKYRRIYFIKSYQKEALLWLNKIGKSNGTIFNNRNGSVLDKKNVEKQLKRMAVEYNIPVETMYPHSFRHLFGKTFYDKYKDLPLLSDILGHTNIATTQIYTRRTAQEQSEIMNNVVTW